MPRPSKDDNINIVGAGVFGLSTALHFAKRGYQNVTVFDKQPYDKTAYSYLDGCDAASAGEPGQKNVIQSKMANKSQISTR